MSAVVLRAELELSIASNSPNTRRSSRIERQAPWSASSARCRDHDGAAR